MKWILLLLVLSASNDDICRKRLWRCERQCSHDHTIGSMDHLNCNQRCREDYRYCREEGP